MWSFKKGGLSWQSSLKTGFTVVGHRGPQVANATAMGLSKCNWYTAGWVLGKCQSELTSISQVYVVSVPFNSLQVVNLVGILVQAIQFECTQCMQWTHLINLEGTYSLGFVGIITSTVQSLDFYCTIAQLCSWCSWLIIKCSITISFCPACSCELQSPQLAVKSN